MAITIQQQPDLWTPAYNPMEFVLDSSNSGQPNFTFIADIYVSGSSGRQLRMRRSPSPIYSQGIFDVSPIIQTFLGTLNNSLDGFDINKTTNGFGLAASSMLAYEIKFGEQYGATSAITTYPDLSVTGTKYTFNGCYDTATWNGYNFTLFDGTAIAIEDTNETLNRMPYTTQYQFSVGSQDRYLHFITNSSNKIAQTEIKTYDFSGNLVDTGVITNPYAVHALYAYRRQFFSAGIRSLNNATYSSGSITIDDSVSYYTVDLQNNLGVSQLSSLYRFNNDVTCYSGRVPVSLHWLNDQGAFDSKEFTMVNRNKTKKTESTFKRKLGIETNNAYGYSRSDAGTVVIDTTIQERYELQMDWYNLEESFPLTHLIQSPVVFLDINSKLLRGRVVSPTETEHRSVLFGNIELDAMKIIFEPSVDSKRQRA